MRYFLLNWLNRITAEIIVSICCGPFTIVVLARLFLHFIQFRIVHLSIFLPFKSKRNFYIEIILVLLTGTIGFARKYVKFAFFFITAPDDGLRKGKWHRRDTVMNYISVKRTAPIIHVSQIGRLRNEFLTNRSVSIINKNKEKSI